MKFLSKSKLFIAASIFSLSATSHLCAFGGKEEVVEVKAEPTSTVVRKKNKYVPSLEELLNHSENYPELIKIIQSNFPSSRVFYFAATEILRDENFTGTLKEDRKANPLPFLAYDDFRDYVNQHFSSEENPFDWKQRVVFSRPGLLECKSTQTQIVISFLCLFSKLECLQIHENGITKLPSQIGDMTTLRRLDIEHNCLTELPREIGRLVNLKRLNASNNQLKNLPDEFACLKKLKCLDLGLNHFQGMPKVLFSLSNLKILDLSCESSRNSSQFGDIPPEIEKLENLEEFYAINCGITSVPDQLKNLKKIQFISLKQNDIKIWSKALSNLQTLYHLNLEKNVNFSYSWGQFDNILSHENGEVLLPHQSLKHKPSKLLSL